MMTFNLKKNIFVKSLQEKRLIVIVVIMINKSTFN